VILAVGQVLSGKPILGVWISFGLMCAAVCWMLYAWVQPSWAFLGGFLVMLHPSLGLNGYWAQSYWGGAVAATGGALGIGGRRSRSPVGHLFLSGFAGSSAVHRYAMRCCWLSAWPCWQTAARTRVSFLAYPQP